MSTSKFLVGATILGAVSAQLYPNLSPLNHTCALQTPVLSCPSPSNGSVDVCCAETYGGLVLATQFWQTYTGLESQGQLIPPFTWTLHGLWPDFCNGSYTQYCDLTRQYDPSPSPDTTNGQPNGTIVPPANGTNITSFIEAFGRYDLLAYMNMYWVNQGNTNEVFWAHEFSKHATCFSTFSVPCYGPQYVLHQDVIDFFDTAVSYYQRFPTWGWLAQANIRPSNSSRISFSAIQQALIQGSGATPYIGCSGPRFNETLAGANSTDGGRTVLSETWYYNYVYGRPQAGVSIPVNATGSETNCARANGSIWYYEPTPSSLFALPM